MKKSLLWVLILIICISFIIAFSSSGCGEAKASIIFMSNRDGNQDFYTMDLNGLNLIRLTDHKESNNDPSFQPVFGNKIVFDSYRTTLGTQEKDWEIYIMNLDGLGEQNLTTHPADDVNPCFSPDGSKIAFSSSRVDRDFDIHVMDSDGRNEVKVADSSADDKNPCFSPKNGKSIVFDSDRDGNYEIYIMNTDGTGTPKNLTNTELDTDTDPCFSPDESKIAFVSDRDGNNEIYIMDYIMNTNSTGRPKNLTNTISTKNKNVINIEPCFSPDGKRIAFVSNRDGHYDIFIMNIDGSGQTNLTKNSYMDRTPSFSLWGF